MLDDLTILLIGVVLGFLLCVAVRYIAEMNADNAIAALDLEDEYEPTFNGDDTQPIKVKDLDEQ